MSRKLFPAAQAACTAGKSKPIESTTPVEAETPTPELGPILITTSTRPVTFIRPDGASFTISRDGDDLWIHADGGPGKRGVLYWESNNLNEAWIRMEVRDAAGDRPTD